MDNIKKFLSWLKILPVTLRALVLLAIGVIVLIASMSLSACGTTKVTVRNGADSTSTSISVQTNNPTSVDASPKVSLTLNLDSLLNSKKITNGN